MAGAAVSPTTVARAALVAVWATLPFTAGPAFAEALADHSARVQRVDSVGLWLAWTGGLVASLVLSTVSLTALRILAPASVAGVGLAVLSGVESLGLALVATAATMTATVLVMLPGVGDRFADGSSYGDERRFLLKPPAALVIGPIPAAWALVVLGAVTGPMLMAAGAWVGATIALVVGWPVAALLTRSLHSLSRRWLVFVPAGLVVHDAATLVESAMVQRREITSIARASADTEAYDLTAGAAGAAIEVTFSRHVPVTPRPARRPGRGAVAEAIPTTAILVAPVRIDAVLAEAAHRHHPDHPDHPHHRPNHRPNQ